MGLTRAIMHSVSNDRLKREGLIGLFALHMMEKGPVHGSDVANRISELTGGAWRPGAGAIYPTLLSLSKRGLIAVDTSGQRKRYHITSKGRETIERVRRRILSRTKYSSAWRLILDMIDPEDRSEFIIQSFRSGIGAIIFLLREEGYIPEQDKIYLARIVIQEMNKAALQIKQLIKEEAS